MKKKILIGGIILVLVTLSFFIGKQLIWNYKVAHAEKKVLLVKNQVPVFESVNIKALIKEINGTLTTNPKIDTSKIGKQVVKFNYTTEEGYPVTYEVEIEVVDITPPIIFMQKSKTIYTGYDKDLSKALFCGDNYDPNPKCTIEGDYDVNTPGQYDLTFVGEDSSGNKSTNHFTLTVKNKTSSSGGGTSSYTDFKKVRETYQTDKTKFGIDVSHWQGDINFQKVKDAGVEFVYIRVGRGDGIGKDYVLDDKFERNIKGFNDVGIPVGVYFYSNADSRKDAEKEAKWLLKQTKNYQVDLEYVYDWENWESFQEYDLSFYELRQSYEAFRKTIESSGKKAMLYGSKSYLESIWENPSQVWLAHYTQNTNYMGIYRTWQLCDNGKVDGISGYVDLDIRYE